MKKLARDRRFLVPAVPAVPTDTQALSETLVKQQDRDEKQVSELLTVFCVGLRFVRKLGLT